MTVVITVLLAVIGSIFVLMARVEKTASSARTSDQQLKLAVDSVAADISQVLAIDVPGTPDPNTKEVAEYYDYPGDKDIWLACIEPNDINETPAEWKQITDLYDKFRDMNSTVPLYTHKRTLKYNTRYGYNYEKNVQEFDPADADGDGIVDSRWVKIPDLTTTESKDVYAAVRIIDNCGMINVNTAYKFNPDSTVEDEIDGSSVAQIDLKSMAEQNDTIEKLHIARTGIDANNLNWADFELVTYWPEGWKQSFDISTELDLRNRFFLNSATWTRFESFWPDTTLANGKSDFIFGDGDPKHKFDDWYNLNQADNRHLLTAVSKDRVIDADGQKAYSINREYSSAQELYQHIRKAMDPSLTSMEKDALEPVYAQVAASLYDYRDENSEVSAVEDLTTSKNLHFGYERPCIWISEITTKTWIPRKDPNKPITEPNNADIANAHLSFSIELFKQQETPDDFNDWQLVIDSNNLDANTPRKPANLIIPIRAIDFNENGRFLVKIWEDPCAVLSDSNNFNKNHYEWLPENGAVGVDPQAVFLWGPPRDANAATVGAWKFDFYFGTDPCNMAKVIPAGSYAGYIGSYNPGGMSKFTTYYWKLDDIAPDGNMHPNDVYHFKTGDPAPDVNDINVPGTKIFDANTVIRLERPYRYGTRTGSIIVDRLNVPRWLTDHNDANSNIRYLTEGVTRSFNRALDWGRLLQRMWDVNGIDRSDVTLGDWNGYDVQDNNDYLWLWPRNSRYNNVGDVALTLKKPLYLLPGEDESVAVGYTSENRLEKNVRMDLTDPNMQRIFNYITVFDPAVHISDPNYQNVSTVYGRLNVNTAPWRLLTKLPWVSIRGKEAMASFQPSALAEAIVAYRDKLKLPIDYSQDSALQGGREKETGIGHPLREDLGFESVAELAMVTNNDSSKEDYDMWWYAKAQTGDLDSYPDLTHSYWRAYGDGIADDFEERYLIFSRISDICTVRSDVFTAYILVRLGQDGPQRRMIAIFDRSEVTPSGGKVKLLALQPVPEVR